jgi:glycine cleavage system pyridoxal-binding protein P
MKIKETVTTMKKETNTKEQKQMLLDLGLSRQEIINLKYEDKRVQKILELQKSGGVKKVKTPESELKRQFDSIKDENKPDQVKTLLGFGLTKAQVRELKYEKDRVEKILELMKNKK